MASALFISHIPYNIKPKDLEQMFVKDHLSFTHIESLETQDRAMVTCVDQGVADRLIERYNGRIIHGHRLKVEPWMRRFQRRFRTPLATVEKIEYSAMNPQAKPFVFPTNTERNKTFEFKDVPMEENEPMEKEKEKETETKGEEEVEEEEELEEEVFDDLIF